LIAVAFDRFNVRGDRRAVHRAQGGSGRQRRDHIGFVGVEQLGQLKPQHLGGALRHGVHPTLLALPDSANDQCLVTFLAADKQVG
jgi:hypothetical protein